MRTKLSLKCPNYKLFTYSIYPNTTTHFHSPTHLKQPDL